MKFEVIDGVAWRVIAAKRAGKTPARPERRELWSRDPEEIQRLLAMCELSEKHCQQRNLVPRRQAQAPPLPCRSAAKRTAPENRPAKSRLLPDWPAVMRPGTAAAYLDISVSTFLAQVAPSVPSVRMTTRIKAYMRMDLDAWALARRDAEHPHAPVHNPWDDI